MKGAEMLDNRLSNVTHNYAYTLNQLEQAIQIGLEGATCDSVYKCNV